MRIQWPPRARVAVRQIGNAAAALQAGCFVIAPTDTVYGIFCDALEPDALRWVCQAKGRARGRAMPLAVDGAEGALQVASSIPESARALMERFWPGPLTLLLPALDGLPRQIVSQGRVGVREHGHPLVRSLVRAMDGPLVATSANFTGGVEPVSLDDVPPALQERAAFVFDQGVLPAGQPSTVVDTTVDPPRIVRHGLISAEILL